MHQSRVGKDNRARREVVQHHCAGDFFGAAEPQCIATHHGAMTAPQQQHVTNSSVEAGQIMQHVNLCMAAVHLWDLLVVVMPTHARKAGVVASRVTVVQRVVGVTHELVHDSECLWIGDERTQIVVLPHVATIEARLGIGVPIHLFADCANLIG